MGGACAEEPCPHPVRARTRGPGRQTPGCSGWGQSSSVMGRAGRKPLGGAEIHLGLWRSRPPRLEVDRAWGEARSSGGCGHLSPSPMRQGTRVLCLRVTKSSSQAGDEKGFCGDTGGKVQLL